MASDSGQKFIRRNRPPRVHITYENPANAEEQVELPFVMGVMADLSGNAPGVEKEDIANRKFLDIDMDNFDKRMAAIAAGVAFRVANKLGEPRRREDVGQPRFNKMEDFSPAAVARQVPALGQAAGGARPARQPAALHGRQGGGGGTAEEAADRSRADGCPAGPRAASQPAEPTTEQQGNKEEVTMATEQIREAQTGAGRDAPSRRRIRRRAEAELQAADRARRDRSRECGHDPRRDRRSPMRASSRTTCSTRSRR